VRDLIISEIKRLAAEGGGVPPGQNSFTRATGITDAKWRGVIWLRWSDALSEAGFAPNEWNQKLDSREIVERLAGLCRKLGRLPTHSEVRMERQLDPGFPSHSTISNHFRTNEDRTLALRQLATEDERWSGLLNFLPDEAVPYSSKTNDRREGMVYLLKSGKHYKIGRSDDIERRFREVTIALPESVTLVHAIRTDDPSGIEAYWHRRFAEKRANGEWFSLTGEDVRAFRKRTFQ
jgi:hypothetical protein